MKSKKFVYTNKDIKQLKKDIVFRVIFSIIFLAIFIWQIALIVDTSLKTNLSIMQWITSIIVLISSLMLCLVTMFYAFKDFRIIATIKMTGHCTSSVTILFKIEKRSFLKLYNILNYVLSLTISLVLVACITYSILQITYFATVSFYLPLLLIMCASGYTAIYHVKDEIRTQQTVQVQQPQY